MIRQHLKPVVRRRPLLHKPVLQALVLADHVYVDAATGKKVIAGTFNELQAAGFPTQFPHVTFAYLCLADLRGPTRLELRYVDLANGEVLMQLEDVRVTAASPLDSTELIVEVPEFPMPHPGTFALEVHCRDELLGSLRINVREVGSEAPLDFDRGGNGDRPADGAGGEGPDRADDEPM